MNLIGKITHFTNGTVTVKEDSSGKSICVPYKPNGNFNHSFVGDRVELVIDNTGLAIDCLNPRHKK